jgi:hypothetical protein
MVKTTRIASVGSQDHVARWFFMRSSDVAFPKTLPKHTVNTTQLPPDYDHIMLGNVLAHGRAPSPVPSPIYRNGRSKETKPYHITKIFFGSFLGPGDNTV